MAAILFIDGSLRIGTCTHYEDFLLKEYICRHLPEILSNAAARPIIDYTIRTNTVENGFQGAFKRILFPESSKLACINMFRRLCKAYFIVSDYFQNIQEILKIIQVHNIVASNYKKPFEKCSSGLRSNQLVNIPQYESLHWTARV